MDIYQKILATIHGWEAGHDGQPPTWLQLHPVNKEGFGKRFDYKAGSIQIIYSEGATVGEVNCGQGLVPESK